MAITNFIPTVWSENLYTQLDRRYIAVSHCNRDYEGEIKEKGSVVNIIGVGAVNVFDYNKDTDMSAPQAPLGHASHPGNRPGQGLQFPD